MTEQEAKDWLKAISVTTEKGTCIEQRKEALFRGIKALEEVQQYREIGTVKEIRIKLAELMVLSKRYLSDLSELMKYQAIGTVEELKEAEEKQNPKKPYIEEDAEFKIYHCPRCEMPIFAGTEYCSDCGQKLLWKWGE